jgi:hypothetical protein
MNKTKHIKLIIIHINKKKIMFRPKLLILKDGRMKKILCIKNFVIRIVEN